MSADPARAGLDAKLLEWMRSSSWRRDDSRFRDLAVELFSYQFERCDVYRNFCVARGSTPDRVNDWKQIPAVPTGAFKEFRLAFHTACRQRKEVLKGLLQGGEGQAAAPPDTNNQLDHQTDNVCREGQSQAADLRRRRFRFPST